MSGSGHKKKFDLKNLVVELMDSDTQNEIKSDDSDEKRPQYPQWQQVKLCFYQSNNIRCHFSKSFKVIISLKYIIFTI